MLEYRQIAKVKRECLGLTQKEFGNIIGYSSSAISAYEAGTSSSDQDKLEKTIRLHLRMLEDRLDGRERRNYELLREVKLIALETNDRLIEDRILNLEFSLLHYRKILRNERFKRGIRD